MNEVKDAERYPELDEDLRLVRTMAERAEAEAKLVRLAGGPDEAEVLEEHAAVLRLLAFVAEKQSPKNESSSSEFLQAARVAFDQLVPSPVLQPMPTRRDVTKCHPACLQPRAGES